MTYPTKPEISHRDAKALTVHTNSTGKIGSSSNPDISRWTTLPKGIAQIALLRVRHGCLEALDFGIDWKLVVAIHLSWWVEAYSVLLQLKGFWVVLPSVQVRCCRNTYTE